jgi:hypothetical protein
MGAEGGGPGGFRVSTVFNPWLNKQAGFFFAPWRLCVKRNP